MKLYMYMLTEDGVKRYETEALRDEGKMAYLLLKPFPVYNRNLIRFYKCEYPRYIIGENINDEKLVLISECPNMGWAVTVFGQYFQNIIKGYDREIKKANAEIAFSKKNLATAQQHKDETKKLLDVLEEMKKSSINKTN